MKRTLLRTLHTRWFLFLVVCTLSLVSIPIALAHSALFQPKQIGVIVSPPDGSMLDNPLVMTPQVFASTSSRDIWVASSYSLCGYGGGHCYASNPAVVFEHYDGKSWTTSYAPGIIYNTVTAMTDGGSGAVYTVGSYSPSTPGCTYFPDVLHWNRGNWERMGVPVPTGATAGAFATMAALSSSNIWAAGTYTDANSATQPLLEHYDGKAWSIMSVPANIMKIVSLTHIANTSTVMMLGSDGITAQVIQLN